MSTSKVKEQLDHAAIRMNEAGDAFLSALRELAALAKEHGTEAGDESLLLYCVQVVEEAQRIILEGTADPLAPERKP